MVTWLQIQFYLVIGIGLRVTKLVTNGYIGYKGIKAVQKGQKLKMIQIICFDIYQQGSKVSTLVQKVQH